MRHQCWCKRRRCVTGMLSSTLFVTSCRRSEGGVADARESARGSASAAWKPASADQNHVLSEIHLTILDPRSHCTLHRWACLNQFCGSNIKWKMGPFNCVLVCNRTINCLRNWQRLAIVSTLEVIAWQLHETLHDDLNTKQSAYVHVIWLPTQKNWWHE